MNVERLLAHYQRIADAPDAIPRLRRFVLDLAVRGKLVPQDPSDEPALELLKRIAKEKARLVKVGEIRKPKELMPLEDYELPFALAVGWAAAPLDQLSPRSLSDGDWIETKDQSGNGRVRLINSLMLG
jgi:type I restriction enzyme, S subunit